MIPSIFVAIPAFGYVINGHTSLSLFRLGQKLTANGVRCGIAMLSYPDIAETRNVFISMWYYEYPQYSHLLFIDADMEFAPELVMDMLVLNKPVTGTFYRKKNDKVEWVGLSEGQQSIENGFMPVDAVGMGVTLISRDCIATMIEKYPELVYDVPEEDPLELFSNQKLKKVVRFFDKMPLGYAHRAEDFSFCKRYRDVGGEIYANVAHQVGHIGTKNFKGRLWDEICDQPAEPE